MTSPAFSDLALEGPNRPTPDDIESFIGTLETSYTYDPPERWREAYNCLSALRPRFRAAKEPYVWLPIAGFVALLVGTGFALFNYLASNGNNVWWMLVLLAPSPFEALANHLARHREPLLRYEAQIDSACGKFDRLLAEHNNARA